MNVCRICVREQDPLKDLLDANNTSTCKIVEKFTQKSVSSRDELPTKICLNCQEKFVTFELFLVECQKAQEDFLKTLQYSVPTAFEVKTEVSEDQCIQEQSNSDQNDEFGNDYDDDNDNDGNDDDGNDDDGNDDDVNDDDGNDADYRNSSDYDEMDEIALSSLKKIMIDDPEQKDHIEDIASNALEELYKLSTIQITDIVKYICHHCGKKCQNWPRLKSHCITEHQLRPQVFCVCGATITTRSGIYAHLTKHKTKQKELKCRLPRDGKKHGFGLSKYIDFSCRLCQEKYYGWSHLKRHYYVKHKGQRIVVHCSCGRELQSRTMVYMHVKGHENLDSHRCEICTKVCRSLDALEKHKMRHIPKPDRRYKCRVCDKEFKNRDGIRVHEKIHIPIENRKVFQCDVCDMKFTAKARAMMHRRIKHEKVKPYVCDLCGFTFATCGELKQHRAIHSDEKPFQCEKCNKCFKTNASYRTHMDIHEGTSYPCHLCNRVLNSRRTLRMHLLVHEDQCKHVCSYCGKGFKRRQNLIAHVNIHTGDRPISCKICGDKFPYASALRSHRIRVHPDVSAEGTPQSTAADFGDEPVKILMRMQMNLASHQTAEK